MAVVPGALLMRFGRRQPDLQAVHPRAAVAQLFGGTFDVRHSAAGGHPADFAGAHALVAAEAVLVQQLTLEQVGEGGEADMRMLADVHAAAGGVIRFQHMVEKHEGADTAAFGRRQRPQDRLAFDVFGAGRDNDHERFSTGRAGRCTEHNVP